MPKGATNCSGRFKGCRYTNHIYKPLGMQPTLRANNVLNLQLRDPGWLQSRKLDDFIPDRDHLMHLYLIRWPQKDVTYRLYPGPATMMGAILVPCFSQSALCPVGRSSATRAKRVLPSRGLSKPTMC